MGPYLAQMHFSTNLTSEKHILSEEGILEFLTVYFVKKRYFLPLAMGPYLAQMHFSTNLTSEKHILSEDGILEFSTVYFVKKILFAIGNGAIFGPKYRQTRALFAKVQ